MGWKTLYIESKSTLRVRDNSLVVIINEIATNFHLDDLDAILIDNYKTLVSTRTLIELGSRNICVIFNDLTHQPLMMLTNLYGHFKPLKNLEQQIKLNDRTKNNLRQQLIQQKIRNQQQISKDLNANNEVIEKFEAYYQSVNQGDKRNREAAAARLFFKTVYGFNFVRFHDDAINSALNFGYKVLASRISTAIISYGLNPALGIFHITKTNYFNLTYDFIEPFRPLIDLIVHYYNAELTDKLSLSVRLKLTDVLDYNVIVNDKVVKVRNAIDELVKSYISVLNGDKERLTLPNIYSTYNLEKLEMIKEKNENGEFI